MRISALRVDGFGPLADLEIRDLPRGLTVLTGPNEAGKSTLLEFVRFALFGLPRGRNPRHEPLRGGRHGGAVHLVDDAGGEWLVERHTDAREPRILRPDGSPAQEAELRSLLGGADRDVFQSVFAFGLDELQSISFLDAEEVRDRIFTAGVVGTGSSATKAIHSLEDHRHELVRPRADARANGLRHRLDAVEADLRARRASAVGFATAEAELRRLAEATESCRQRRRSIDREHAELERLVTWAPIRDRLRRSEARRRGIAPETDADRSLLANAEEIRRLANACSGHLERTQQLASLHGQRAGIQRQLTYRVTGTDAEERGAIPVRSEAELLKAEGSVQTLHGLISEREQLRTSRALAAATVPTSTTPRSLLALLAVAVALAAALAAVGFSRHQAALATLAVLAGVVVTAAIVRLVSGSRRRRDDAGGAPGDVDLERLGGAIGDLARSLGLAPAPASAEVDALARALSEERDRRRQLDADTASRSEAETALGRVEPKITELELEVSRFESDLERLARACALAVVADEPEGACAALSHALEETEERHRRLEELDAALEADRAALTSAIGTGPQAQRRLEALDAGDPAEWTTRLQALAAGLDEAETAWKAANDAETEAQRLLDDRRASKEVAELELEAASLSSELDNALSAWLTLGLASQLLERTLDRYERERQPAVIARAAELFSLVTSGRYVRLVPRSDERSTRLVAITARDEAVESEALSRGTAEQLYLCLRLALASTHAERTVALPFVLDDVLVNFDPDRAEEAARAIAETAAAHQVLAFTCHPHVADALMKAAPSAHLVELAPLSIGKS